jgi:protein-S-isoprenylcysteine O-methyltransferase Ste14
LTYDRIGLEVSMSTLKAFVSQHPRLVAWVALAIGMVAILLYSARDVGLELGQSIALVVATIGLAGLCVWIIGWEEDEVEEAPGAQE